MKQLSCSMREERWRTRFSSTKNESPGKLGHAHHPPTVHPLLSIFLTAVAEALDREVIHRLCIFITKTKRLLVNEVRSYRAQDSPEQQKITSFPQTGRQEHRTPAPIWGRRTQCPGKSGLEFKEAVPGPTASKNSTQVCVTEDYTKRAIWQRPNTSMALPLRTN